MSDQKCQINDVRRLSVPGMIGAEADGMWPMGCDPSGTWPTEGYFWMNTTGERVSYVLRKPYGT
jgi:hypothetical protein